MKAGRLTAYLAVNQLTPREWTPQDIALLEETAQRTWTAVQQARAEAALRQSKDRLRLALESAQLGTWDWDIVENRFTWDTVCKTILGVPLDTEASLEVFFQALHPDERERLQQGIQEVLNPTNDGYHEAEYRVVGIEDQSERWVRAKGQVYFDATGNPLRFIGTILDITAKKQAEATIKTDLEATQLLRDLSTRLVSEDNVQVLYEEILAAAIHLLHADAGTMQILDEATQDLLMLATQGLDRTFVQHFYRVDASSNTSCGLALKNGTRSFINFNVPEVDDPHGSAKRHFQAGYLSAQSTPLISRNGK
ncbi:MAG: PAS domain-containing protein [Kamptonema sp. SIO4C4]|nr:PAS domain-containing protein [Kamptonema sp. SIO4C4]